MIAAKLVSNTLVPLRTSDTGDEALAVMNDFHVKHLPVVNNKQLLGIVSEDDILDHDVSEAVGSYHLSLNMPPIHENDHLYEVMRLLAEYDLTTVAVVDDMGDYLGLITQEDILHYFAKTGSFTEPGSIIVLELDRRDYSMAEISRIVESEQAQILSSFISSDLNSTLIHVTLKINSMNLQPIVATFERFDYKIKATFNEREFVDTLKDRIDSLMNYLNV